MNTHIQSTGLLDLTVTTHLHRFILDIRPPAVLELFLFHTEHSRRDWYQRTLIVVALYLYAKNTIWTSIRCLISRMEFYTSRRLRHRCRPKYFVINAER